MIIEIMIGIAIVVFYILNQDKQKKKIEKQAYEYMIYNTSGER